MHLGVGKGKNTAPIFVTRPHANSSKYLFGFQTIRAAEIKQYGGVGFRNACEYGAVEVTRFLLKYKNGLQCACFANRIEVAKCLLKSSVSISRELDIPNGWAFKKRIKNDPIQWVLDWRQANMGLEYFKNITTANFSM